MTAENLRIDHVSFAVRDETAAAARLRDLAGLEAAERWSFEGSGLANRMATFSPHAIELLTIDDPGQAATQPLGMWLAELTKDGDRPGMWVVATDDIDAVGARLGVTTTSGGARDASGTEHTWRMAGVLEALAVSPFLPWFISYDGDEPARREAATAGSIHENGPHALSWIELAGDESALTKWLGSANIGIDIRFVEGPPGIKAFGITTGSGEVELR